MADENTQGGGTKDVEALVAERVAQETAGLKSNRDEVLKELKKAQAALKNYEGVDPEKARELQKAADEAERKRVLAEGDFKALEAQLVKKYEGLLEQEKGVSTRYRGSLEKNLIDAAALTELAKHTDSPKLLLPHIRSRMKVVESDGEFSARIVDESGQVRVGKGQGSTPMTLSELIEEMKQDREFAPAFRGTGSSGGGATKSNGGAGGARVIAAGDNDAFFKNLKGIAKGEVQVTGL